MLYMVTFTINIPPMLAYIPYMDPMGITIAGQFHRTPEEIMVASLHSITVRRLLSTAGG